MSATGEVQAPTVEVPPATTAAEESKEDAKPMIEKKPRVPREKKKTKQVKTASHPPYFQMIKEAVMALKEKSGSSPYAIAKYMEEKHKAVLPANFKKILAQQLKNCTANGKLIKIKASYKLSETGKKEEKKPTLATEKTKKKPKQDKTTPAATPRATRSTQKVEKTKKVTNVVKKKAKKAATSKPKQPKSIKSPAAKRAKKVSA